MPALLLALVLAAGNSSAEDRLRVETSFSAGELAANAFLLPLALAFNRPHYGFEARPYEGGPGYGRGERDWAAALRLSGQALGGGRSGGHAELQVRAANRLGWQASWDGYALGALRPGSRGDLWSGHITCNYAQTGRALFELGLGGASLRAERSRAGPSAALLLELFPRKPWTLAARCQSALLRGQFHHVLSARAGASVLGAGVYAGYGAFLSAQGNSHGPEAGLAYWF